MRNLMRKPRILLALLMTLGVAPPLFGQADAPSLQAGSPAVSDEARSKALFVIGRHIRAVGGEDVIKGSDFMTISGAFEIEGANFIGHVTSMRSYPPRLMTRLELGQMGELTQGYDGAVAWTVHPVSGPSLLKGPSATSMARNADIQGDLHYEQEYETIEFQGDDVFNEEPCFAIRLVDHEGTETVEYYAKGSGLRIGVRGARTAGDSTVQYTRSLENYEEYGLLRVPTKTVETIGQQKITVTIEEVSYARLTDDQFKLPEAVAALLNEASDDTDDETDAP